MPIKSKNHSTLRRLSWLMHSANKLSPVRELDDLDHVPEVVRELIVDRLEAALREGLLQMTPEQYHSLLCALMPDDFVPPPTDDFRTFSDAGTNARVLIYAERARRGVQMFHAKDKPKPPDEDDEADSREGEEWKQAHTVHLADRKQESEDL
jgi:hypothetical protein